MLFWTYILSIVYSFVATIRIPTICLWVLVVLALGNSLMKTDQGWGMYHYYIGSKYFAEVGYFDLYECTVGDATPRRDLRTYDYRIDSPDCQSVFSYPRYINFRRDIASSGFYEQALIDKGYNGTPVRTAIFGGLANLRFITLDNAHIIDIIALVSALFFCVYHIGWRKSAYIALFVLMYNGTTHRLWGHYAQWVRLSLALAGVVLLEQKKTDTHETVGALLIGISTTLAIFPAFLMLRYLSAKNIILFFVAVMTFYSIGMANGRQFDGYIEFVDNMSIHSSYIRSEGCCNIGLAHTITSTQYPDDSYRQCFSQWSDECALSYDRSQNLALWLLMLPLILLTPLGAMYGLLTLSTYYYLKLAVIAIWYIERWIRLLILTNAMLSILTIFMPPELFGFHNWIYFIYFLA